MSKKIGLIGTPGAGKTTTFFSLAGKLKAEGKLVNVVMEAGRQANQHGFKLQKDAVIDTQFWIMAKQIEDEMAAKLSKSDFILTDRTVYDVVAFAGISNFIQENSIEALKTIIFEYGRFEPYDLILFFPPLSSGPEDDGLRDLSSSFITDIENSFYVLLDALKVEFPPIPIYEIKSKTKKKRVEEAYLAIKDQFPEVFE